MPYNEDEFKKLLGAIKDGSFNGTELNLSGISLNDEDFSRLIVTLRFNKELQNRMTHLNLSFNTISHLGNFIFAELPNLRVVNMSSNHFDRLPIFDNCYNLEVINFSRNNITGEIRPLSVMPSLRILDLSNNSITHNPSLANCKHLESVNLAFNGIQYFNPESGYVTVRQLAIIEGNNLPPEAIEFLASRNAKKESGLEDIFRAASLPRRRNPKG